MIGRRLKVARASAGLSLRELAARMDGVVSPQAIGKYERNEDMPGSRALMALASALGVSEGYLLSDEELVLEGVDFRKKTSAKEEATVEALTIQMLERYLAIEDLLQLKSVDWEQPRSAPYPVSEIRDAEDAARSVAGITNSDGATAAWSANRLALAASNGLRGRLVRTRHSLSVNVLAGSGTLMQDGDAYRQATHRADLAPPATVGREAGERAAARLGPRKIATARVPVVYEPRTAASLLRHLAVAINGNAVASGRSFLKGSLGQPVFGAGITISDDPLRRRGLGSRPFDSEGVATANRRLIDGGVLTTWLLDLASGRRLGMTSTGHASRAGAALGTPAASNLTLAPGTLGKEALIADIAQGLYVTDLMGMGANLVTGDYSRGASGFWIEDGAITYPVGEVTIAGNLVEMFRQLTPASDLEIRGSADAPTVRIDGMTVAGT